MRLGELNIIVFVSFIIELRPEFYLSNASKLVNLFEFKRVFKFRYIFKLLIFKINYFIHNDIIYPLFSYNKCT